MLKRRYDFYGLSSIRNRLLKIRSGLSRVMKRLLYLDKIGEAVEYGGRLIRPSISIIFGAVRKASRNSCFRLVSLGAIKGPVISSLQRIRHLKISTNGLLTGI